MLIFLARDVCYRKCHTAEQLPRDAWKDSDHQCTHRHGYHNAALASVLLAQIVDAMCQKKLFDIKLFEL